MMLLRSLLFTPGNNLRMIAKAGALRADAVILDLEDSVPPDDKETARLFVRDSIRETARRGSRVFVRINAPATGLSREDLEWAVQPGLDGIMLPKSESAEDVISLSAELAKKEAERGLEKGSLAIVPLLESARGVVNAAAVAAASPRIAAVAFGGVDFSRDMGLNLTKEGTELLVPRANIAIAARAAGVLSIDTPCIDVNDPGRLAAEARAARGLGFRGKLLIHPSQVGLANEAFSPTAEEVATARRVVEAFEKARAAGSGAISLDGKMIDQANYRQAKDCLAWAEAGMAKGAPEKLSRSL
jgi:citrate lyase subunit beta/citryl-CoA lyase